MEQMTFEDLGLDCRPPVDNWSLEDFRAHGWVVVEEGEDLGEALEKAGLTKGTK